MAVGGTWTGEGVEAAPPGKEHTGAADQARVVTLPALIFVVAALVSATASFVVLIGLTPVSPAADVVNAAVVVNLAFVLGLIFLIGREIRRIMTARRRGKAAARLHVRITGLFSVVAIAPAILVAIVASITLDLGLDRWFSMRTQAIVNSSLDVAEAYVMENARYLQGQTVSMANDLDNARPLYTLDRSGFELLMTRQANGRGLLGAFLVRDDGSVIMQADIETDRPLPAIPQDALRSAGEGRPTLIPPGVTNLVGAVLQLQEIPNAFLYTIRAVDPNVMDSMQLMEENTAEYQIMEQNRTPLQLAFGILYIGFALVVLLAAIWTAIAVADRIIRPVRLLIGAADEVAAGDFSISVPVRTSDGDVAHLSQTFNNMIVQIRTQRDQILAAKDEMDERRRFTEAVLAGVTAGVMSVDRDRRITISNSSAEIMLDAAPGELVGKKLSDVSPELDAIMLQATVRAKPETRQQISLIRGGIERTLNVQLTREEAYGEFESYVVTLDDITDLVIAQRATAWADVARRIAHEIKNPLTPIQLSAERIRRRYGKQIDQEDKAVFDQCTETIVRQVEDIGRMVDEFSAFARMPKPTKEEGDLRSILRDAIFLREVGRSDIEFQHDLGDDPIIGHFDGRMLSQAFANLIKNAAEAIDAVPSDAVRTGKRILVKAWVEGEFAVVDVVDNGRGLPTENRNRILEPYITMREKGTGLGLAIVKKIVEDHQGTLELHDAPTDFDPNGGAKVRVRLRRDGLDMETQGTVGEEANNGV